MKNLIGIDIGTSAVKLAQVSNGKVVRTVSSPLPGNPVQNGRVISVEELGQALRKIRKEGKLKGRRCALVLPPEVAFVRRVTMPYMTETQLKTNLPFELQDYIQNSSEQYFYDYALLNVINDEEGNPAELDLLAAATPREVIEQYRAALEAAGLHLVLAVPQTVTYRNIIRTHEQDESEHPEEYCIADMGHSAIRVHMYRGDAYETSRVIEYGGEELENLESDSDAARHELFDRIALEIMRAVNFYGFNTPDSNLQDIYFCGGLSQSVPLMAEISSTLSLNCHPIEDLLPPMDDGRLEAQYGAAVGATLQSSGR